MFKRFFYVISLASLLFAVFSPYSALTVSAAQTEFDDSSGCIVYTGNWTFSQNFYPRSFGTTLHWSNFAGSTASCTFNASRITYKYTMASNRGSVNVYIDNSLVASFSEFTPVSTDNRYQIARTWAVTPGVHTIKVSVVGNGYVDLDSFITDIDYTTASASEVKVEDTSGSVRYINGSTPWTHSTGFYTLASASSISWSNVIGDAVSLTFFGDQIGVMSTAETNRGKAIITIDGNDKGLFDLYGANTLWENVVVFRGLGTGFHTINVAVSGQQNPNANGNFIDIDAFSLLPCPGNVNQCRAYSFASLLRNADYTGVQGVIEPANPTIRDGATVGNFSSQVIWIGTTTQYAESNNRVIEVGWRKTFSSTYIYYGIYNPSWNSTTTNLPTNVNYTYQINHSISDNKWHISFNGQDYCNTSCPVMIGPIARTITAGGEVTDASFTTHNALGVSGFLNLQYKRNDAVLWSPWNNWGYQQSDYSYLFTPINSNSFQVRGYNP